MWFCIFGPVVTSEVLKHTNSFNIVKTDLMKMSSVTSLSGDDVHLFDEVQQEIASNVRHMMESLWMNWSHLGIDHSTKCVRIRNLVSIEKDLHKDVIKETEQKLKALSEEVEKLKAEAAQLGQYLSVGISIQEFSDDIMLADYKRILEDQIVGYRHQVEQRKTVVKRLTEWQRNLCEALGVTEKEIKEMPLPSEEELATLTSHLDVLQEERDKRMAIFLNAQKEIKDIMESLSLKPLMKFESLVVNSLSVEFKVTDRNMERLAELLQSMRDQLHETNNRVLELRERLNRVWDMLEEDRVYRSNFLHAHPGCSPATEKAIRDEIARCDLIKIQKIQVFVAKIRTEIKKMWDKCMYSERQRNEFLHYYQDIFSEDTLTLHELYLDDLNKIYNDNRLIYETYSQRCDLWDKMVELEVLASNPNRYQNRGGQLLKEEKQRKCIANKLPKIEAQLEEMVKQYEAANGKEFTVNGKPLLEIIRDDWEARRTERQNKMSARKQALTPNTPYRSLAISPGKRNRTAAGLNTGDRARSAKRPLITASASKLIVTNGDVKAVLKRQAITSAKKRVSDRIAQLAAGSSTREADIRNKPRRKLNYNEVKPPRIAVNGSILKHKRRSRRSSRRSTRSRTSSSISVEEEPASMVDAAPANQVADSTMLSSYTDFKEHINENTLSRSSLVQGKVPSKTAINSQPIIHEITPKKTPISQAFTPKHGKENIQHETPFRTPIPRSAKKDVFATPRAPLSAAKMNVPRQMTPSSKTPVKTPSSNGKLHRQNTLLPVPTNGAVSLTRSKTTHALTPRNFLI